MRTSVVAEVRIRHQASVGSFNSEALFALVFIFAAIEGHSYVQLVAPVNGASYLSPARIELLAETMSDSNTIIQVEFLEGTNKIGEVGSGAYSFIWDEVAPGAYDLSARSTDEFGMVSVSPAVRILVVPSEPPIGINFSGGAQGTIYTLEPSDRAGIVPQIYWNNANSFFNGNGQAFSLRNGIGQATPVSLSFDFSGTAEESSLNATISPDYLLMKGYLLASVATNSSMVFSQVPFSIYDVIVYSDGQNGGTNIVAEYRLGTNILFMRDAANQTFNGNFISGGSIVNQGTNTASGNYVRFNGITTNSFTLQVWTRYPLSGGSGAAINAVQIVPSIFAKGTAPRLTRGPYLQGVTTNSIIVRWRTNRPLDSRVRFGTNSASLDAESNSSALQIEHTLELKGLLPDTKYFYSIGTSETNLLTSSDCFFSTAPLLARPTRIWVIGDSGTANDDARSVRDAYLNFAGSRYTDIWLMLGDNAYNAGTDTEYQAAVFNMYPTLLRQTVVWPTIGNHETDQLHSTGLSIPYFQIFNVPANGEAGGVPSGTERYYAFDYGNIHFVCLDSMTSDRSSDGAMCSWLRADLEANTKEWTLVFWHHPPYSKGNHDSDNPDGFDFELVDMRENVLPILEAHGTDLVLCGHSHAYERSFLIHGHYGYSTNLLPGMVLNSSSGDPEADAPYEKSTTGGLPYIGTVYVVAGSSGKVSFGYLNHPVMFRSMARLGSLVIDVNDNELQVRFLGLGSVVEDEFAIIKHWSPAAVRLIATQLAPGRVTLEWATERNTTYFVQCTTNLARESWHDLSEGLSGTGGRTSRIVEAATGAVFYRVVAVEQQ